MGLVPTVPVLLLTFPLTAPGPRLLLQTFPGSSLGSPSSVQLASSLPGERPSSSYLHLSWKPGSKASSAPPFFFLSLWPPTPPVLSLQDACSNSSLLTSLGLGPLAK